MVAMNEQFHHNGAHGINSGTTALRRRLRRNGESGVNFIDQRSRIADQKRRSSNDLFIDHYSLVIERSAGANGIIYCGYPDNNRVPTDIGTGLNDPESELYYVRNRTFTLLPSDQRHGWEENSQAAMLGYYRDLRTRLGSGGPVKSSDIYGLGRGLNDLGVQGGELSDYACMICDELKDAKCLLEKEVAAVKSAAG